MLLRCALFLLLHVLILGAVVLSGLPADSDSFISGNEMTLAV